MQKEILLYTSFNAYSVSDFITELEANKGNDVVIRMNTPGGSVYDGYGAIAKYKEFPNKKSIKVDGRADSFGAYFVCMADDVECLDVSNFTFHRAAMPSWFEADANLFTDEVKANLNNINASLRAGIESKVDAAKWKRVTGVSLDDMFSLSARINVPVNAKQAEKLGIVNRVVKITPSKLSEIKAYSAGLAAEYAPLVEAETTNTKTTKHMTAAQIKAEFPEVYEAIQSEALTAEKERVAAFNEFKDIDAKSVLDAIVSGEKYGAAFAAKMTVKAMSKKGLANIEASNAGDTNTDEQAANADSSDAAAFEAQKAEILKTAKAFIN